MTIYRRLFTTIRAVAPVLALIAMTGPVLAHTCEEEMPRIKAEIDAMPGSSDKNLAEHQYEKAQERLAAGKEASCLRYLEAARAAIEAFQMHDD